MLGYEDELYVEWSRLLCYTIFRSQKTALFLCTSYIDPICRKVHKMKLLDRSDYRFVTGLSPTADGHIKTKSRVY